MKKKIIVIHGWSDKIYHNIIEKPTEKNYFGEEFISKISEEYEVVFLNLPGFFDKKEPDNKEWYLDDYSKFLNDILEKNNDVDFIIARSFGGAVAIKAKVDFNLKQKLILFAPAIVRKVSNKNIKIGVLKKYVPKLVLDFLRDVYLIHYIKNPFYTNGTSFLRKTYRNIVSIELIDEFKKINPKDILVFFGKDDTATPPSLLLKKLGDGETKSRIKVLKSGGHNFFTEDSSDEKIKYCLNEIKKFI